MLSLRIAWRYLYGKKSTNSINIITGISIFGISIGTAALILILSVFNGLQGLLSGLFNAFNPDLKVVPIEGKFYEVDETILYNLLKIDGIESISKTIDEVALFEYKGIKEIGVVKGVDQFYQSVTKLDTHIINGRYLLRNNNFHYAIIGSGMSNKLSINTEDRLTPLTVFMPARKKKGPFAKDFITKDAYPAGIFSVRSETDMTTIISHLEFVQKLLDKENSISALEIKLYPNADEDVVRAALEKLLPSSKIKNRYEQDEAYLKVMEIEKWFTFLITGLTVLLIAFNLVGALWMIVLDKRRDISVLKSLGYQNSQVRNLFLSLGLQITLIGIILGFILAIIMAALQTNFGLIGIPDGFLIDAYPVKLEVFDFIITFLTVCFLGILASSLPSFKAGNAELNFN